MVKLGYLGSQDTYYVGNIMGETRLLIDNIFDEQKIPLLRILTDIANIRYKLGFMIKIGKKGVKVQKVKI
ncbi:MAG: hypothetical protein sL5_11210 [Candidatus Mesenet longicola]|uniref:Uncharacterized protein n=1 Tax=Candidatus Mesenet longicola TaxID=1892558 RepID=A0A8J3HTS8_9RICK|nr:MAG: hypothetical protein sGL2_11250 [Candidatus Mesenet longicola]GHM60128.1 MAG: hypothetical protein sL5_11210 [Candidatus Mesenet longicola]